MEGLSNKVKEVIDKEFEKLSHYITKTRDVIKNSTLPITDFEFKFHLDSNYDSSVEINLDYDRDKNSINNPKC